VGVHYPTPELFRGLARSSPWRWRALELDLHRRPLHGPEHTVRASVRRGVGLEVWLADGQRHEDTARRSSVAWVDGTDRHGIRELPFAWELPVEVDAHGFVVRRPPASTSEDPMWQDYQWVAMLDPVELADGCSRNPSPRTRPAAVPDAVPPPALLVHRLDAELRHGRETWWAEVSPLEEYSPRCSCCPLLFGRVSEELEALAGGPSLLRRQPDLAHATTYLVALDVGTGVCVDVDHLDGDHVGRGFSVELHSVDGSAG